MSQICLAMPGLKVKKFCFKDYQTFDKSFTHCWILSTDITEERQE